MRGLERAEMLTADEATAVLDALDQVEPELVEGKFAFEPGDEDIHTAIERRVTELAGRRAPSCTPAGAATTRSRPPCACT